MFSKFVNTSHLIYSLFVPLSLWLVPAISLLGPRIKTVVNPVFVSRNYSLYLNLALFQVRLTRIPDLVKEKAQDYPESSWCQASLIPT